MHITNLTDEILETILVNQPEQLTISKNIVLPKDFAKLTNLRFLNLNDCFLKELPEDIGNLKNLTKLLINYNSKLKTLPHSFCDLIKLTFLEINLIYLQTLPDCFGNLKNLRYLSSRYNKLNYLPDSICELQLLEYLDVSSNFLQSLPDCFGNLRNLKNLNLTNNQLTHFPNSICELQSLESLESKSNNLTSLPDCFGNLKKLRYLDLSKNKLTIAPISLSSLDSIKEIYLSYNLIENIEGLPYLNVTKIDLNYNNLSSFIKLDKFKKLSSLLLLFNPLKSFPSSMDINSKLKISIPHDCVSIIPEDMRKYIKGLKENKVDTILQIFQKKIHKVPQKEIKELYLAIFQYSFGYDYTIISFIRQSFNKKHRFPIDKISLISLIKTSFSPCMIDYRNKICNGSICLDVNEGHPYKQQADKDVFDLKELSLATLSKTFSEYFLNLYNNYEPKYNINNNRFAQTINSLEINEDFFKTITKYIYDVFINKIISKIDILLKYSIPLNKPKLLYRGFAMSDETYFDPLIITGMTSFSMDLNTAKAFALSVVDNRENYILKITFPIGTKIIPVSACSFFKEERELLIMEEGIIKNINIKKEKDINVISGEFHKTGDISDYKHPEIEKIDNYDEFIDKLGKFIFNLKDKPNTNLLSSSFKKFCRTRNLSLFDSLSNIEKKLLYKTAQFCIDNNVGYVDFAKKIFSYKT